MPLPLTVSCFRKIQIGFTFLVPAYSGSPGQKAAKRVCVCVCSVTNKTAQTFVTTALVIVVNSGMGCFYSVPSAH